MFSYERMKERERTNKTDVPLPRTFPGTIEKVERNWRTPDLIASLTRIVEGNGKRI